MSAPCSRKLGGAILLLAAQLHAAVLAPPPAATPAPNELQQRARRLIIPAVEFREATLQEAVDFLRARARALDPAHQDLQIQILPTPWSKGAKITLALHQISLEEALHYAAAQARLNVRYRPTGISIEPDSADIWRRHQWPGTPESRKLEALARTLKIPRVELRAATFEEALDFLRRARTREPDGLGLNIVNLDVPPSTPDAARITIAFTNQSLFDVLQAVAHIHGASLVAEPEALVVKAMNTGE